MRLAHVAALVLPSAVLVAALGCTAKKASGPAAEPATAAVSVTRVDYDGLDKAVKNYQGKVVLIDVWFRA